MRTEVKRNYFTSCTSSLNIVGEVVDYTLPVAVTIYTVDCKIPNREKGSIRLRFYCPKEVLNPDISFLLHYLQNTLVTAKVEYKRNDGYKITMGNIIINGGWKEIIEQINAFKYHERQQTPIAAKLGNLCIDSIKIAHRKHYQSLDFRTTVDYKRLVFSCTNNEYDMLYLGDLGPRVELKCTEDSCSKLNEKIKIICPEGYLTPYSSLELLGKSIVDRLIIQDNHSDNPEIEAKLAFTDNIFVDRLSSYAWLYDVTTALKNILTNNSTISFLLPSPGYYSRTRRYHLCKDAMGEVVTVVETSSGHLSIKRKKSVLTSTKGILVRECVSNPSINKSGSTETLTDYLSIKSLHLLTAFEKHQCKLPIVYKNYAFCISVDISYDLCGAKDPLRQVEVEYIGIPKFTENRFSLDNILRFLEEIASELCFKSRILRKDSVEKALYFLT